MPYKDFRRIPVQQYWADRIQKSTPFDYENEEKLLATMTDEQKKLFSRYTDAVHEQQIMSECMLFQNSFKLGAKMMVKVMDDR